MSKFLLSFKGDKEELHKQLKKWCKESGRTINGLVIELIFNHLKKGKKKIKDMYDEGGKYAN